MENKAISKVLNREKEEFEQNFSSIADNTSSYVPATQVGILALIDENFPEVQPHEVRNVHPKYPDEHSNSDHEVESEDLEWLDYMTKEGLADPGLAKEVDDATLLSKVLEIKEHNKQLGKGFRQQKRMYKQLVQCYNKKDLDRVKEISNNIFLGRIDVHRKLKNLHDKTVEFTAMSTDTCFESLGNMRPLETVELKKRQVSGKLEFGCTECTCWKATRGAMENHLYVTHGVGGMQCPFCEYITGNSRSLYVHSMYKHQTNIGDITLKL